MVMFKPNVRITAVDGSYNEDLDSPICVRFNTGHAIVAQKPVLGVLYLLNGHSTVEQITAADFVLADVSPKEIINDLLNWEIIYEIPADLNDGYIKTEEILRNYVVHFPKMSNINTMIAVLLHHMHVKTVFYNSDIITPNDTAQNIYFKYDDIGRDVISFIQNRMKIDTVCLENSDLNSDDLEINTSIIVNSDDNVWVNDDNFITINTWNYQSTRPDDFKLFNGKVYISDTLKGLVGGYILAIRSVDDMLNSVRGNLFF